MEKSNTCQKLASGGAHLSQLRGGALSLVCAGILADDATKLANRRGFLAEFGKAKAFSHHCGSGLEAFGIVFDDLVVCIERGLVFALYESDFAEIELCVGSQVGITGVLEIVLKLLRGEIV